ncbi:hypothetical protein FJY94_07580 [Candidatus Kaiserbacteria bacterium]|nr:hypothetical protein [Candidatus Kaiserbacteria bacterium]
MTNNPQRELCPHCHGMNEECSFCDGGWISIDDSSTTPSKGKPTIPAIPPIKKQHFSPKTRRIVLYGQPSEGSINIELLQRANKEILRIDSARKKSVVLYSRVAHEAFHAIKKLMTDDIGGTTRERMRKLLNTAYFHMKKSQAISNPDEQRGSKSKTHIRPKKATTKSPSPRNPILGMRLREAGLANNEVTNVSNQQENRVSESTNQTPSNMKHVKKRKMKSNATKKGKSGKNAKADIYQKGKRLSGSGFSRS